MIRLLASRLKSLDSSSGFNQGFSFSTVPFDPRKRLLKYVPETLLQEARQSERETDNSPSCQKKIKETNYTSTSVYVSLGVESK